MWASGLTSDLGSNNSQSLGSATAALCIAPVAVTCGGVPQVRAAKLARRAASMRPTVIAATVPPRANFFTNTTAAAEVRRAAAANDFIASHISLSC